MKIKANYPIYDGKKLYQKGEELVVSKEAASSLSSFGACIVLEDEKAQSETNSKQEKEKRITRE